MAVVIGEVVADATPGNRDCALSTPPQGFGSAGVYDFLMRFLLNTVGWGIVIYALMYLLWSGLVMYGLAAGMLSLAGRIIALACITTIAARSLHLPVWKDLCMYVIAWVAVTMILDAIFLVPFTGFAMYSDWSVWAGYALIAIFPLLTASSVVSRFLPRVG